jgi:hypothetical protein
MESTVCDRSARWRGLLARQISSGLSVAAFCRREGVALSTFRWWKRKLASSGDCGSPGAVDWVEVQPMTPPSFPGGAAVRLGNGVTEIDNNRCEQSIRPIALGRKNCLRPCSMAPAAGSPSRSAAGRWLHVGSQGAAPAVAAIMSLVESCKRMGIIPRTYLEDVLPQLASAHSDKVAELATTLTPSRWQAASTSVGTAA